MKKMFIFGLIAISSVSFAAEKKSRKPSASAQQANEDVATTNCIIAIAAKSVAMPSIPAGRNVLPAMPAIPPGQNVDPAPIDKTLENVLKVVSNPSSSIHKALVL